jgi:hypothetical protein
MDSPDVSDGSDAPYARYDRDGSVDEDGENGPGVIDTTYRVIS